MLSQPDELIGTLVAERYRIKERLGRGGMGTVFLAEHEAIRKKVALKVLHPEYSAKPDLVERFQREAISASRVKHVNVLEVFDFGQLPNGCFYLAMEFLEGHDLADELERHKALAADRVLIIAKQICRALAAAHSRGVVHRDLKPENVFLSRTADGEEVVKIVDFGIAQLRSPDEAAKSEPTRRRLTRTGMIFGTPEYMSPEQAQGARSDHRVDVYATGVILFEMLTGAVPFTAETFLGVLQAHLNKPLLPMKHFYPEVQVSEELEAVIAHALEKDAEKRFAHMNDLAAALLDTPEGRRMRASVLPPAGPALDRISSVPTASHPGQPTSVQFDDTNPEAEAKPATRAEADTVAEAALPLTQAKERSAAAVTALGSTTPSPTDEAPPPPRRSAGIWLVGGGFVVACLAALGWYVRSTSLQTPTKAARGSRRQIRDDGNSAPGPVHTTLRAAHDVRDANDPRRQSEPDRRERPRGRNAVHERSPSLRHDALQCLREERRSGGADGGALRSQSGAQGPGSKGPDREARAEEESHPRPGPEEDVHRGGDAGRNQGLHRRALQTLIAALDAIGAPRLPRRLVRQARSAEARGCAKTGKADGD